MFRRLSFSLAARRQVCTLCKPSAPGALEDPSDLVVESMQLPLAGGSEINQLSVSNSSQSLERRRNQFTLVLGAC